MKIRSCFVSNSSSSAFMCDVCGGIESGLDASLSDFEMSECENGHTICNSHIINDGSRYEYDDCLESTCCPLCQFENISNVDFRLWFFNVYVKGNRTEPVNDLPSLLEHLKNTYTSYKEFNDAIRPNT